MGCALYECLGDWSSSVAPLSLPSLQPFILASRLRKSGC